MNVKETMVCLIKMGKLTYSPWADAMYDMITMPKEELIKRVNAVMGMCGEDHDTILHIALLADLAFMQGSKYDEPAMKLERDQRLDIHQDVLEVLADARDNSKSEFEKMKLRELIERYKLLMHDISLMMFALDEAPHIEPEEYNSVLDGTETGDAIKRAEAIKKKHEEDN